MPGGRYVVLGLAQARSAWFRSVAQWSNSASLPLEFVKVVSALELQAHLRSGRPFSALLIDGGLPALDRDLIDEAARIGCAVIVIDDVRVNRDWRAIGAHAVVNPMFGRQDLLDVLAAHASLITRGEALPGDLSAAPESTVDSSVALVCGSGGTGASTVAAALAQGLGDDIRFGGLVLLADLKLRAEQALLHDAHDVVPGVQEVVEAHRAGQPTVDEIRALSFAIEDRHYDLLLGLRHPRHWAAIRPRAFDAAFDGLSRAWRAVVCDVDADFETEPEGGSADVEDRTLMARTAAARADVAFVVGLPGVKGLASLGRVVTDLVDHHVPPERIVAVVNRAPKGSRARAELDRSIRHLLGAAVPGAAFPAPLFLPERHIDEAVRDSVRLPTALSTPLAAAFFVVTDGLAPRAVSVPEPERIRAGQLGSWSPEVAQ